MDQLWEPYSSEIDESLLVLSGYDIDGEAMYVGRCCFGENILPAKVIRHHSSAAIYVAYQGLEHTLEKCEVLINTGFRWIPFCVTDENIPANAVVAGISEDGNKQFVGRAEIQSVLGTPGRVPSDVKKLYLPYDGKEVVRDSFDILVTESGSCQSKPKMSPSVSSPSTTKTLAPTSTCSICREENIEIVGIYMDCGHACLCNGCIEKVNHESSRNGNGKINCPICRKENPSARKIFYI